MAKPQKPMTYGIVSSSGLPQMHHVRSISTLVLVLSSIFSVGQTTDLSQTYEIYAGSRGDGVPETALLRLQKIEEYLIKRKAENPGSLHFRKSTVGLSLSNFLCKCGFG
jgi:hypothetical protein